MSDHAAPPPPPSSPPPATPPPPPASPPPASPPPPMASSGSTGGGASNPVMIVLSYMGPLALIPYLVEKEDAEVQWHAKHGLVLTGAWLAIAVAVAILAAMLGDPGCLGCITFLVLWVPVLVLHIVMIAKALNGQRFKLPGISDFADKF